MNATAERKLLYYRLVALWVLCEAMLGGVIHGLRLPVSGLFVGSSAVICISLIAYYIPSRTAIIKATIIVAIFKMMLSPQAPPMAYVAVFFQGFAGEIIFYNRRIYKLACYLFAIIALVESALQRILVSIIVYGIEFWKAIDTFLSNLTNNSTSYSLYLGTGYILIHIVAGLIVGYICSRLPMQIENINVVSVNNKRSSLIQPKHKGKTKKVLFVIWIVLFALYLQSEFKIGEPLLSSHISIRIITRSVLILLAWYFVISPVLIKFIKNWLSKKQYKWKDDIDAIVALLPSIQSTVQQCWQSTAHLTTLKRMKRSIKLIAANIIKPA